MLARTRPLPGRLVLSLFLLFACALGASSCATPASPTFGTVSAAGLAGPWKLEILQRTGGPAIAVPPNTVYTLTFADPLVSVRADCNTCVGSFTIVGDAITLPPVLACTRAACPTAGVDVIYTDLLQGESRVGVLGQTMVLNSARGQLRFRR